MSISDDERQARRTPPHHAFLAGLVANSAQPIESGSGDENVDPDSREANANYDESDAEGAEPMATGSGAEQDAYVLPLYPPVSAAAGPAQGVPRFSQMSSPAAGHRDTGGMDWASPNADRYGGPHGGATAQAHDLEERKEPYRRSSWGGGSDYDAGFDADDDDANDNANMDPDSLEARVWDSGSGDEDQRDDPSRGMDAEDEVGGSHDNGAALEDERDAPPVAAASSSGRPARTRKPAIPFGEPASEAEMAKLDPPEKPSEPINPDSMIRDGTIVRHGDQYSYLTGTREKHGKYRGHGKHVETTAADGSVTTVTRHVKHIPGSKRTGTQVGKDFVRSYDHYDRTSGQKGQHQMVQSHNTPSRLGMRSGGPARNGSLASNTYNKAVERFDSQAIQHKTKFYSYTTASLPKRSIHELANDDAYLAKIEARMAGAPGWNAARIKQRLVKVAAKNPAAAALQGETRTVKYGKNKQSRTFGPDYHAFLPQRVVSQAAMRQYQIDTGKLESDHDDSDLEESTSKIYPTAEQREAFAKTLPDVPKAKPPVDLPIETEDDSQSDAEPSDDE